MCRWCLSADSDHSALILCCLHQQWFVVVLRAAGVGWMSDCLPAHYQMFL